MAHVHEHRHRQSLRLTQAMQDAHADIEIHRRRLDRFGLHLEREVAQLHVVDWIADHDQALGVAGLRIRAAMPVAHGIDLADVVLQQIAAEPAHAFAGRVIGSHASRFGHRRPDVFLRGLARQRLRVREQRQVVEVAIGLHAASGSGHMHADRIGVGVDADQQDRHTGAAAVMHADGLLELFEPLQHTARGAGGVAAMRGTAFVRGIATAEVVHADLQIARAGFAGIRAGLAPALQLDAFPVPQAVLDREQRAGMRLPERDHGRRHAQDVVDDTGQPAIGARRDVDRVKAPAPDQRLDLLAVADQRMAAIECGGHQAREATDHALRLQAAQIQWLQPVRGEQCRRQIKPELLTQPGRSTMRELALELLRRQAAQRRLDRREGLFDIGSARAQCCAQARIGQRMPDTG